MSGFERQIRPDRSWPANNSPFPNMVTWPCDSRLHCKPTSPTSFKERTTRNHSPSLASCFNRFTYLFAAPAHWVRRLVRIVFCPSPPCWRCYILTDLFSNRRYIGLPPRSSTPLRASSSELRSPQTAPVSIVHSN